MDHTIENKGIEEIHIETIMRDKQFKREGESMLFALSNVTTSIFKMVFLQLLNLFSD